MNVFDQMREAMCEANRTLSAADSVTDKLASMLVGRLRKVSARHLLRKLKRELRDFNSTTGTWRN